jgi:hypothetical protein
MELPKTLLLRHESLPIKLAALWLRASLCRSSAQSGPPQALDPAILTGFFEEFL